MHWETNIDLKGKRIALSLPLASLVSICFLTVPTSSSNAQTVSEIDAVMALTNDVSQAFSFSPDSPDNLPDFEVLDVLYPQWHKGDPAVGRKFWLHQGYQVHHVEYRPDMVDLMGQTQAKIRGKKLVAWTKRQDTELHAKVWPFQIWAQVGRCKSAFVNCDYVVYTIDYELKLAKKDGKWTVAEEKTSPLPDISKKQKQECSFKKQLGDWCPVCQCPGAPPTLKDAPGLPGADSAKGCLAGGCK